MQEATRDFAGQSMVLRGVFGRWGRCSTTSRALMAHEYQHEVERTAHSPELRRSERVQRLLAGAPVDTAELGYEFDAEHLGVIAMGAKAAETVRALAARTWPRAVERLARRGDRVGVVRRPARARLRRPRALALGQGAGGRVAGGRRARRSGIDGWRLTHRQAQARDARRAAPPADAHGMPTCRCWRPRCATDELARSLDRGPPVPARRPEGQRGLA